MKIYTPHPAAMLLPMPKGEAFERVKQSILERGQEFPAVTHEGKLLDGRTRQEALRQLVAEKKLPASTELKVVPFKGGSLAGFVRAANVDRRHLSENQLAAVATKLLPLFRKEARERQAAAAEATNRAKKRGQKALTLSAHGRKASTAADGAAKAAGGKVSARSVERAERIRKADPKLFQQLLEDDVTLTQAEKQIRRRAQEKQVAAYVPAEGVFQMHTLDFSWPYRDKREGNDDQRGLPYPPQTLEEIVAYIRGHLAKGCDAKGCVVGNWITGPISIDLTIAPVVQREYEALGFRMIHERVWKKVRPSGADFIGQGTGIRWNAEKLQIYVRGDVAMAETGGENPSPLQHTVFEAPVGVHSEKPQKAYDDLQALFPLLTKRLEHHARAPRAGWVTTGAELLAPPPASGESAPAQPAPAEPNDAAPVATSAPSLSSGAGLGVSPESERSESPVLRTTPPERPKAKEAMSIEQLRDAVAKTIKEKRGRTDRQSRQDVAAAESLSAAINAPPTEEQKRRTEQMLRDGSMVVEKKPQPPGQAGHTSGVGATARGGSAAPLPTAPEAAELFSEEYICTGCGEVFVALEILSKHSKRCTGTGAPTDKASVHAKPTAPRPVELSPPPAGVQDAGLMGEGPGYMPPVVPGSTSAVPDDDLNF